MYPANPATLLQNFFLSPYRTDWALKSQETWHDAHISCGRIMLPVGIIALVLAIVGIFLLPLSIAPKVLIVMDIICIIIPYFPIEKKLKQNFDTKGRWKEGL